MQVRGLFCVRAGWGIIGFGEIFGLFFNPAVMKRGMVRPSRGSCLVPPFAREIHR